MVDTETEYVPLMTILRLKKYKQRNASNHFGELRNWSEDGRIWYQPKRNDAINE